MTRRVVDCRGEFVRDVPVSIPGPVMMHDFAITQHYSILMDLPLEFVFVNVPFSLSLCLCLSDLLEGPPFLFGPG